VTNCRSIGTVAALLRVCSSGASIANADYR